VAWLSATMTAGLARSARHQRFPRPNLCHTIRPALPEQQAHVLAASGGPRGNGQTAWSSFYRW
jgi:hypothetical protein